MKHLPLSFYFSEGLTFEFVSSENKLEKQLSKENEHQIDSAAILFTVMYRVTAVPCIWRTTAFPGIDAQLFYFFNIFKVFVMLFILTRFIF